MRSLVADGVPYTLADLASIQEVLKKLGNKQLENFRALLHLAPDLSGLHLLSLAETAERIAGALETGARPSVRGRRID
jgi:hypothetical protein